MCDPVMFSKSGAKLLKDDAVALVRKLLFPLATRFRNRVRWWDVVPGLFAVATIAYALWGAATEGWMMYAVIFINVLGFAAASSIQSIVSNAADPKTQGQAMGAVAALNSLMAVIAPIVGPSLLAFVSHFPRGDWRIGAPYYFCAALQGTATLLAIRHFLRHRATATVAASAAS